MITIRLQKFFLLCVVLSGFASAQTWDTSGNKLLTGTYYFRHVVWSVGSDGVDLGEAVAVYGNISFDGNGNYSVNGQVFDGGGSSQTPQNYTTTGTYSVAANGFGFLASPAGSFIATLTGQANTDQVYGLVSQGIFIGSATDNPYGYNDMLVMAPVSSPPATVATLRGSYSMVDFDIPVTGAYTEARDALVTFSADGNGNLSSVTASGYIVNNGGNTTRQNLSGVKYLFSNGGGNIQFGGSYTNSNIYTSLIVGNHYVYVSPDGSFIFGGAPNGWDMFVGIRTGSGTNTFSGLYYQAGMDINTDLQSYLSYDSYFGSLKAYTPGAVLGHQRINTTAYSNAYDLTYTNTYTQNTDGSQDDGFQHFLLGLGGALRIGVGVLTNSTIGLSVQLQAPSFSGSGVFVDPTGITNAASSGLFTTSVAPGELITIYGAGLSSVNDSNPFMPKILDGVQVLVNGTPAPVYVVSSGAVTFMLPFEVTGAIAQIQVVNKGAQSNVVTAFIGQTAPGVFTIPAGGIGYAAAQHAADFSLITTSNPAQVGETIVVYANGLGTTTPAIASGTAASGSALTPTAYTITAAIDTVPATVSFAGLTPGSIGLYQANVVVPSGVSQGDVVMELQGPDSDTFQALITIGSTGVANARPRADRVAAQHVSRRAAKPHAARTKPLPDRMHGKIE
jgi:uncharacterized protein (TIGR03437 family)